jgi:hypothetical protein
LELLSSPNGKKLSAATVEEAKIAAIAAALTIDFMSISCK